MWLNVYVNIYNHALDYFLQYVWVSWGFRAPHRLFKTLCVTNHKYTVFILILIVISVLVLLSLTANTECIDYYT